MASRASDKWLWTLHVPVNMCWLNGWPAPSFLHPGFLAGQVLGDVSFLCGSSCLQASCEQAQYDQRGQSTRGPKLGPDCLWECYDMKLILTATLRKKIERQTKYFQIWAGTWGQLVNRRKKTEQQWKKKEFDLASSQLQTPEWMNIDAPAILNQL